MPNPWDSAPIVKPAGGNPWDSAPIVNPSATAKSAPATPEKRQSYGEMASNLLGGAEASASMLSGMVAKPVSDIAGLAAMGKEMVSPTKDGKSGDPEDFKRHVQDSLTYQPRTPMGKGLAEYNPLALVGRGVGKAADVAGDAVGGKNSGSARQAAGNFTREAINQAPAFLGSALGKPAAARLAKEEGRLSKEKTQNEQSDASLVSARDKGFVVPPAQTKTGALSNFFQGVVGDVKTEQGASIKNQRVTKRMIKKELGISDEKSLSVETLSDIREDAGKAYDEVRKSVPELKTTPEFLTALKDSSTKFKEAKKDFPEYFKNNEIDSMIKTLSKDKFSSSGAIEMQKKLRADGNSNIKAFDDPGKQALGEAQLNAAKAIDGLIDQNLEMTAPPGVKNFKSKLADGLNESRKTIAKTYAVQGALNDATGSVSAAKLARMWEKGAPLSGALKDVAETHKAFPKAMQDVDKISGKADVTNLDVAKATVMGAAGHGVLGGASMALRPALKPMILSDWYQDANVKPQSYQPGAVYTMPSGILNNKYYPFLAIQRPPQKDDKQ